MMRRYLTCSPSSCPRRRLGPGRDALTGFGGVAFGGVTDRSRGTYGGSLGFLGGGVFGFEIEAATTPEFFGNASSNVFTNNNVLTLMGNLLLAAPAGPVRIYGTAGAGLMKTRLEDPDRLFSIDSNDFGINVGGGLIVYVSNHVGLRGDVRYFRDLQDADPDGHSTSIWARSTTGARSRASPSSSEPETPRLEPRAVAYPRTTDERVTGRREGSGCTATPGRSIRPRIWNRERSPWTRAPPRRTCSWTRSRSLACPDAHVQAESFIRTSSSVRGTRCISTRRAPRS